MPVGLVCQLNYGLSGCLQYQDTFGTFSIVPFTQSCVALRIGQRVTFALRELSSGNEAADIEVQSDAVLTSSSRPVEVHEASKRNTETRGKRFYKSLARFGNADSAEQLQMLAHAEEQLKIFLNSGNLLVSWICLLHLFAPCFFWTLLPQCLDGQESRLKTDLIKVQSLKSVVLQAFHFDPIRVIHGNPLLQSLPGIFIYIYIYSYYIYIYYIYIYDMLEYQSLVGTSCQHPRSWAMNSAAWWTAVPHGSVPRSSRKASKRPTAIPADQISPWVCSRGSGSSWFWRWGTWIWRMMIHGTCCTPLWFTSKDSWRRWIWAAAPHQRLRLNGRNSSLCWARGLVKAFHCCQK